MNEYDEKEYAWNHFQKVAGIQFKDKTLLIQAFTHRSFVNEAGRFGSVRHNERLEFLGDAVLELVVTDYLFHLYPASTEGELTAFRSALVNTTTLSEVAESLTMNECLLLSRGESKDNGRARVSILANTFEAVVGALFIDQGIEGARPFIATHLLSRIDTIIKKGGWRDAKSMFQEWAQAQGEGTPRYEVVSAEGPDHNKHFVVAVFLGEREVTRGEGKSKQEAEQDAASLALSEGKKI